MAETTQKDNKIVKTLPERPELKPGMTVRVYQKITETTEKGERERIQVFEGLILAIRGAGIGKTVTIRKISDGVGVERIYPVFSPQIEKIEVVGQAKVRRAKLNYFRKYKKKLKE